MGAAISGADLWVMKHNGRTGDHQDGVATPRSHLDAPAPATEVGRRRSGLGPMGGVTPYERWAIEARIARINASLQDLGDHVRRLRQRSGPFAPGAPGSPPPAP